MGEFKNVTAVKKANVYFDGKVTSRTIIFEDGERKTLGIMLPGDYEFGTGDKEVMEILGGAMDVKLPGSDKFVTYKEGDTFIVPANSKFSLIIKEVADYCCSYIKE
ncbi:pyrimidine/purine nucleoside phosphorylase [Clostridium beijerinckii]|uniref:pyrimidine/purine nucleoside phosphorylase n=1 Tax=Clostridium beijerinckii TaxID=1520 RepID=UPI002226A8FE|nr:pyrimidine/purine nucleoside phosphorylase [Clostridium beijerinckii]UYZ36933.1 pyrimidine/purine nucleoside phosphorylase [Clostridium beijerinckii]